MTNTQETPQEFFVVYSTKQQGIVIIAFNDAVVPDKYANYVTYRQEADFTTANILRALVQNDLASGTLGKDYEVTIASIKVSATVATDLTEFAGGMLVINPLKIVGGNDEIYSLKIRAKRQLNEATSLFKTAMNNAFSALETSMNNILSEYQDEATKVITTKTGEAKENAAAILSTTISEEEKEVAILMKELGKTLTPRQVAILDGHTTEADVENAIADFNADEDYDEDIEYCDDCDEELDDCRCDY